MELVVISSPEHIPFEGAIINRLFESGLSCFHMRKQDLRPKELLTLLLTIDVEFWPFIAWHQQHDLAISMGSKKLHFSEKMRNMTDRETLIQRKKAGYTLSTSIHQISEFDHIGDFDYTFFGPVFNSISKPGYETSLPGDFVIKRSGNPTRIFALSGVSDTNIEQVQKMNFDGAGLLGAIWNDPENAVETYHKIKEAIKNTI